MAFSGSQKKLLLLFLAFACLSSPGAEAWSWSWSNGSGRGWGSDGSSSSSSGPGSDSNGSSWSWGSSPSLQSDNSGSGFGSNSGGSYNSDTEAPSSSRSVSNSETAAREIVVGGSDGWTKGLDYKKWASKNAPFYVNDVLVFNYDKSAKQRNDVYLFKDPWSYMNCDIKNAKKIGSTNKGSEESFKFTLNKLQPYFFASGEHEGDYCSNHNMKFTVFPVPHRSD